VNAAGLGWKGRDGKDGAKVVTAHGTDFKRAEWHRVIRGFRLHLFKKDNSVLKLDGFKEFVRRHYPPPIVSHLCPLYAPNGSCDGRGGSSVTVIIFGLGSSWLRFKDVESFPFSSFIGERRISSPD